jgi:pilus assembly protein CpaB
MKMPQFDQKKLQVVIAAVAMGLLAIFLVNKYTEQRIVSAVSEIAARNQQVNAAKAQYDAVVAAKAISRGQTIEREMLNIQRTAGEFVQPGVITDIEVPIGKIASADILPGEQVTFSKLGFPGAGSNEAAANSLAIKTPTGKRAVTITIDPLSAAGGMVKPGDYVDVIGNFPVPQQVQGKMVAQLATVTLFQNVLVLAVGGQFSTPASAASSRGGRGEAPVAAPVAPQAAQTITFALPPKEAELLLFASEQGILKLILRSGLDNTTTTNLPVATWDALLQYIISAQGQQATGAKEAIKISPPLEQKILEIYRAGNLEKEPPKENKEAVPTAK